MMTLTKADIRPDGTELTFNVKHNVGALPTTVDFDLVVKLGDNWGKQDVTLSMNIGPLTAADLDEGRLKMATWCERMAAALRYCERKPNVLLPDYGRAAFELSKHPSWLQREFHRLTEEYKAVPYEDRSAITKLLVEEKHPLVLIPDAIDAARRLADATDDDE